MREEPGRILVFARAPAEDFAKSRRPAALLGEQAVDLARAYLRDTWELLRGAVQGRAEVVIALDGDPTLLDLDEAEIWPQGGGDLGDRLEAGFVRAFDENAPWVIAVDADSPGIPRPLLLEAVDIFAADKARRTRTESVIGPCDDGSFYLIGLRRLPSTLLTHVPWSAPSTFAIAHARLETMGLQPVVLEPWFHVGPSSEVLARLYPRED